MTGDTAATRTRKGVVRARLLGGFDVVLPDGTTAGPWERPAARRLVQLLLLSPQHQVGREHIAATLFPNLAPDRAPNAVSKALTMARTALGETRPGADIVLEADRSTIRIRPELEVTTDVGLRREEYADAIRQPAGPRRQEALDALRQQSFALLPEEPYADWTQTLRDELVQLQSDVLVDYARGCPPEASVQAWAEVVEHEPTNEEATGELVARYLAAGQRDRAIRTYHRCRAALLDQLGVAPSAELTAMLGEDVPGRRVPAPSATQAIDPVATPTGRDDLLSRLVRTCDSRTPPRAVTVVGPAGIGKTTLVRAAVQHLETAGWSALHVTVAPDDRLAPYAGLRSLLQQLMDGPSRERLLLLDAVLRGEAPATTRTPEATRGRLAQELATLLDEAAAAAPLVVVIDDAHWMDEAQRVLVARIATGPPSRWLLLVVARSDEPHSTVPDLPLASPRLEVPPLPPDSMRELVRTELSNAPDDVVEHLVQRSRGNAFFGLELARQWALGGASDARELRVPDRIVDLLRRRIEACSVAGRQLVPLVALAGPEATYELVLRTGAQPELAGSAERCMRSLDELTAAHLLVETPTGLRLLHPLLRDAALTTINPIRRAMLHRMLGDALREIDGDPLAIARHRISAFAAARLVDLAADAAEAGFAAGRIARSVYANDAALELLRGALDAYSVVPGAAADRLRRQAVDAWVTIADIHLDDEDSDAATDAARVAIALAENDDERAAAWAKLAGVSYRRGDMARFGAVIEEGLQALVGDSEEARARLLSDLGWYLHRQGQRVEARELLEQAHAVLCLLEGDDAVLIRVLDRLALSTAWFDPEKALSIADEARARARRCGDETLDAVVLLHRAEILSMCERTADGLVDLDMAAKRFSLAGDRYMQSVTLWVRAIILERHGDPVGALAAREAEAELLTEVGNFRHLADSHRHRAQLLTALGREAEAQEVHLLALQAARDSGDPEVLARVEAHAHDPIVATGVAPGAAPKPPGRVREE